MFVAAFAHRQSLSLSLPPRLLSHHFLCILIETCDTGATPKTPYFSPPVPISCRVTRDRLFTPVPPFLVNINRDLRHGCDTKPPYSSPPIPISSRVTREPSLFGKPGHHDVPLKTPRESMRSKGMRIERTALCASTCRLAQRYCL